MTAVSFLPGTGRGTMRSMVEGRFHEAHRLPHRPSTTLPAVPLPVPGRSFA